MIRLALVLLTMFGFVAAVIASFVGNRPSPERFLTINGLAVSPETSALARERLSATYRGRVAGALIGGLIGAIAGHIVGQASTFGGGVIGVLSGAMAGMAIAQSSHAPSAGDRRSASLDVRDPISYEPKRARLREAALAVVIGAYGFVVVVTIDEHAARAAAQIGTGVAAILALAGGRWIRRRIVEHRRGRLDPESVNTDDALRAVAVRAIHHATMGVLCCGLLLLGIAAVRTQTFHGLAIDGHPVVRVAPGSHDLVVTTLVDGARARWVDRSGTPHSSRVTVPSGTRHAFMVGVLWDHGWLVLLGHLIAIAGFIGALVELRRASRAWRYGRIALINADAVAS